MNNRIEAAHPGPPPNYERYFVLVANALGLRIKNLNGTEELIGPCGSIGTERIIVRATFPLGTQILNPEDIKS